MAELIEFGSLYAHTVRLRRGTPLVHRAPTHEIDEPFRSGRSFVFRLWPFRLGIVVGRWSDQTENEQEALLKALLGREYEGEPTEFWSGDDDGLACDCGGGH